MELLSKLGIDWSLLVAQMVNFGVLVGLLTFFIYRPLLNVLDARREKIRKSMEDVKLIDKQKKDMEALREAELRKIDQECGAFMEKTKQQAEKMRQEILATAKKEADQLLERGRQQLENERGRVFADVQNVLTAVIMKMTQKIIEREFSKADQDRILASLSQELPKHLR